MDAVDLLGKYGMEYNLVVWWILIKLSNLIQVKTYQTPNLAIYLIITLPCFPVIRQFCQNLPNSLIKFYTKFYCNTVEKRWVFIKGSATLLRKM